MLDSKEKIEQRQSTSVRIKLPWGIKGIEEIQQRIFSLSIFTDITIRKLFRTTNLTTKKAEKMSDYENDIFYSVILLFINFVHHGNEVVGLHMCTCHQWQTDFRNQYRQEYPMLREIGLSSFLALSKASSPHGYQSTGLYPCCNR